MVRIGDASLPARTAVVRDRTPGSPTRAHTTDGWCVRAPAPIVIAMRSNLSVPTLLAICALAILASTTVAASPYDATARCDGVRLRVGPSTAYQTKATIDRGTTVTVAAEVAGAAWSTLCGGQTYSGSKWAKVVAVDGVPTTERYGVKALYAALGLLRALPTPSGAATPRVSVVPTTASPSPAEPTAAPPTAAPSPSAATPTTGPTGALPTASSTAPPSASPARQSGGPVSGPISAAGPLSGFGTPAALILLALAVASVALSWIAYRNRGYRARAKYMARVEAERLKDVLE